MAVDKNKLIGEATKLVQKGAFDKAIKLYEKILQEDPRDVRVLLKVGELHQKRGEDQPAADAFKRVAETYAEQGFFLKAVAVYKQVAKLNADDVRVNERLAGLYQQLGLMSDVMAQLQAVATAHEKAGDGARLLEVLKRMFELDPENIGTSVRLGKLFQSANQPAPALEHYRRAANYLKKHNRADEYLKIAERIAELAPNDLTLVRELANIYMAKGDTKRALAKLQVCFKADPNNVETLNLLARAFKDLGQVGKTVQVFKTLAALHQAAGRPTEVRDAWRRVQELAPDDADAVRALEHFAPSRPAAPAPSPASVRPAPAPPPARAQPAAPAAPPPPARQVAAPAPPPPRAAAPAGGATGGPEAAQKLLTETDVYLKYGLADKAIDHLRKVLGIDPQLVPALERLRDLHESAGRRGEAVAVAENAVRACLTQGLVDRAREALARLRQLDPNHPALGELAVAAGGTEEIQLSGSEVEEFTEAAEPMMTLDDEPSVLDLADETVALAGREPSSLEEDRLAEVAASASDDEVVDDEPALAPPRAPTPPPAAPRASAAPTPRGPANRPPPPRRQLEPELEEPGDEALAAAVSAAADLSDEVIDEPVTPEPRRPPVIELPGPPAPPEEPARDADLSDELEEADFFVQQAMYDEARETLKNLLALYPDHLEVRRRLADLDRRTATPLAAKPVATTPASAGTSRPAASPAARPAAAPLADLGAVLPVASGGVRQSPDMVEPSVMGGAKFDIGAELAEELGDSSLGDGGGLDDDFQYTVEDVFNQFKKGVAETVGAEDSDTHYDLGIAYKEMGLLEDAVNEFETALRGNNRKKEIDSLSMIALCRMTQGKPKEAIGALRRALRSDFLTRESAKAIHFELGVGHEVLGEREVGLWFFQKVLKLDPGYRDVAGRVAALGGGPGKPPADLAGAPGTTVARKAPGTGAAPGKLPAGAMAPGGVAQSPAAGVAGAKKNIGFL